MRSLLCPIKAVFFMSCFNDSMFFFYKKLSFLGNKISSNRKKSVNLHIISTQEITKEKG